MQQTGRQSGAESGELYEQFAASIFAYARLFAPSPEDAEDVTVEVFVAAWEQENLSWMSEKQQLVWLRRVAHNKLVDRYRRSAHLAPLPLDQIVETALSEEHLVPEQILLRREELERLTRALGQLPPTQQQVLQLRFGEALRFAEIAVLLNKREGTVRKLCSRSLASLRSIYRQQEQRKEPYHEKPE